LEQWRRVLEMEHPDTIKAANLASTFLPKLAGARPRKLELDVLSDEGGFWGWGTRIQS
jgi:hypothetical protein